MYLSKIELKNFRNFTDLSLDLRPGVNIILGENNTGKTNFLDAIRIILNSSTIERREIWAKLSDLYHDEQGNVPNDFFEIHLTFDGLSDETGEWGRFDGCRVSIDKGDVAQIHFRYEKYKDARQKSRGRAIIWGGETEGNEVNRDVFNELQITFLAALRDAESDLQPGRGGTRTARLLTLISTSEEEKEIVTALEKVNTEIGKKDIIKRAKNIINDNLDNVIGPVQSVEANLGFAGETEFQKFANSIKILFGKKEKNYFEISENGLGYNNLLYMSTVLGELEHSSKVDREPFLPILAIEEPEAHLHPQSQLKLVQYLLREDRAVQILITSHSPTLASSVPIDRIIVLHEGKTGKNKNKTLAKPLKECNLSDSEMEDLQRYLDITKSTLFFSRGVILVEGISEALLLPIFANRIGIDLNEFRISIVNINSLAFDPFAKLFIEGALDIPCALISDADPTLAENDNDFSEDEKDMILFPEEVGRISSTAGKLKKFENGQLKVFLASKTFEYDLALESEQNVRIMTKIYKDDLNHPRVGEEIEGQLNTCINDRERAKVFFNNTFGKNKREKGCFAQRLSAYLDSNKDEITFDVPTYIILAIFHATKSE